MIHIFKSYGRSIWLWALLCCLGLPLTSVGQNAQQFFGKNRVQNRKFEWKYLSTKNFDIYFYDGGEQLARFTAELAETQFPYITDLIGYLPYNKTRIFVYKSDADRLQTNVGLADVDYVVGGKTVFVKAQLEVAFNGNHTEFKKHLSYEISRLFIYDMMYGGSLRDIIQSTYLLSLPDWFVEGAAMYAAYGWDIELDNFMRDLVLNRKFKKPSNLQGQEAAIYGQSIWNYIAERYGKSNVSNILNLTRIIRNEEVSISSTLAVSFEFFLKEWQYYYKSMAEPTLETIPEKKRIAVARNGEKLYNLRISPDGRKMLYVKNSKGRYKVISYNFATNQRKTIYRGGSRLVTQIPDYTSPVAAWKSNTEMAIVDHKGKNLVILERNTRNNRSSKRYLTDINQVMAMDYSEDGSVAVLSAEKNGQSDLFIYNDRRGTTFQLTNDIYDDLSPRFIPGTRNAFTFLSNRTSDTALSTPGEYKQLKDDYEVFLYMPDSSRSRFKKLTHSPGLERGAFASEENELYFLSEENGIQSLAIFDPQQSALKARTSFDLNMDEFDYNPVNNQLIFTTFSNGKKRLVMQKNFIIPDQIGDVKTRRQEIIDNTLGIASGKKSLLAPIRRKALESFNESRTLPEDPDEIDIYNYVFEIEKLDKPAVVKQDKPQELPVTQGRRFSRFYTKDIKIGVPLPADNKVGADNLTTTAQIDPLMGFGLFLNMGMSDMLGNHRFHGGLFGSTDFRSSRMFAEYEYLPHRIDFRARYQKHSLFILQTDRIVHRYNLNRFEASAAYPFSAASRVSIAPFFAMTRFTNLFFTGFGVRDALRHYTGFKAEYIFDKTIVNGLNMFEGTRAKIKLEQYYGFRAQAIGFGLVSGDIRRYQKIHNEIILATRLSYGQFFGDAPKNFLLGGMDNWFLNNFDEGGIVTPEARNADQQDRSDLLFTEFATNLRGFNLNKLRGQSFMLLNLELRLPLIRYIYKGPITSGFFKNLQFVAFTDIGSAWSGISPFNQNNSFNNTVIQEGAFTANVKNYRNPFLQGQGLGVRTLVFGYYLKFDVAWGIEDFNLLPPMAYVTLGYDF